MLECLDLTMGCWRETGLGGYTVCGPSRSKQWAAEIEQRHHSQYFIERISLADLCSGDTDRDPDDVSPETLKFTWQSHQDYHPELQKTVNTNKRITTPQLKNWVSLRVRLERQVIQSRAPDRCMVGVFPWCRLPDRQLDRMSFRLRHFCPDWGRIDADAATDQHHEYLGVYIPETEESMESQDWYIGNYVMMPYQLETLESLYEQTFDLYRQCFSASGCEFSFPKGTEKRQFYDRSTTCCTWVPYLEENKLAESEFDGDLLIDVNAQRTCYKVVSLAFVPFLIRLLLTQVDLVDRLIGDSSDELLTPSTFLTAVQQFRLFDNQSLFGYNIKKLLWEHSRVFKLEPGIFWDLDEPVGVDPTITSTKLELLCSNCFEAWHYATRSMGGHEKWRQHEALDWISTQYDGLEPFDLEPIEAKLRLVDRREYDPCRGNLAIIDMNIDSKQFVPPSHAGALAIFQVGQRAGLLQLSKTRQES
eukprot:Protomagalhaensia_wolfi_Nauph_80__6121@NODE_881_length_1918_cov_64_640766_g661_i0_p1_GENE_NODE_881_length_1918_cov_64_640766_g661_i0NODE_881_length_1918_cov_64_640766_g661_i0_p1_ORF_typecomplete_len475_score82_84_NODE_881_length_1918_cov_64_640766_g661_i03711795